MNITQNVVDAAFIERALKQEVEQGRLKLPGKVRASAEAIAVGMN